MTPLGWFLDKVAGPLAAGLVIAVLGSWVLARINERYRGRREHMSKSVDALRAQVEAVVMLAGEYWSKGYAHGKSEAQVNAINFKLADINNLTMICASGLWQDEDDRGPKLVSELLASIVTPEFGTATKKAHPAQLEQVSLAAAELTSAVTTARQRYLEAGVAERLRIHAARLTSSFRRPPR